MATPAPQRFGIDVATAYRQLEAEYGKGVAVAARSSATADDLFEAWRLCFASPFTGRASFTG
jgi:phosphoenolpyruvate synthase/pyruvate phosphate dikinase